MKGSDPIGDAPKKTAAGNPTAVLIGLSQLKLTMMCSFLLLRKHHSLAQRQLAVCFQQEMVYASGQAREIEAPL